MLRERQNCNSRNFILNNKKMRTCSYAEWFSKDFFKRSLFFFLFFHSWHFKTKKKCLKPDLNMVAPMQFTLVQLHPINTNTGHTHTRWPCYSHHVHKQLFISLTWFCCLADKFWNFFFFLDFIICYHDTNSFFNPVHEMHRVLCH